MKKLCRLSHLILCISLLATSAYSQRFTVSVGANYGSFQMNSVRKLQDTVLSSIPIRNVKTISSFPDYAGYEGNISYSIERVKIGLFGSFNSTGSRLSYSDFSGSYEFNQHAQVKQFGIHIEFNVLRDKDRAWTKLWEPFIYTQLSTAKTDFSIDQKFILFEQVIGEQKLDYDSRNYAINCGVGLRRYFMKHWFVSATAGYLTAQTNRLKYKEDRHYYLTNERNKALGADWSGYRLTLSIGARFLNLQD